MNTQSSPLTDLLANLHAAIVSRSSTGSMPATVAVRPVDPPAPKVRLSPAPAPEAPPLPCCAPLDALTDLDALSPGPRRLLKLLHEIAVNTVWERGYKVIPSQVTLHQAQELVARALGCHVVTVWRWTRPLVNAGLVAARPHFTTSRGVTRADGTLFAVRLKPGHYAHLTHDDLAHSWRDLDADRAAGRTAWNLLKNLQWSDPDREKEEWKKVLKTWAVTPGLSSSSPPLFSDHCTLGGSSLSTVSDVVYALPLLASAHASKRPALISLLASTLSHLLNDQASRKFWCKTLWNAWKEESRGGLQVLGAQLSRLAADQAEWRELRRPGALLVSRLRAG